MVIRCSFAANRDTDAVLKRAKDSITGAFEADVYTGNFWVFHQFWAEFPNDFQSLFILREKVRPALSSFGFDALAFLWDAVEELRFQSAAWATDWIVARGLGA